MLNMFNDFYEYIFCSYKVIVRNCKNCDEKILDHFNHYVIYTWYKSIDSANKYIAQNAFLINLS